MNEHVSSESELHEDQFIDVGAQNFSSKNISLPSVVEAEKRLLGSILIIGSLGFYSAQSIISAEDFFDFRHQLIFSYLTKLQEQGSSIDPFLLTTKLKENKQFPQESVENYVNELVARGSIATNLEELARLIEDKSLLRKLIKTSEGIKKTSLASSDVNGMQILNDAKKKLLDINARDHNKNIHSTQELTQEALRRLSEIRHNKSSITGLSTGFIDLDSMTSGWQDSDLIILAARPAMGKTALGLSFVEHALETLQKNNQENPVLIFSLEMPANSLILRILSSITRIPLKKIRDAKLSSEQWDKLGHAFKKINSYNLFIDDSSTQTPTNLRSKIMSFQHMHGKPALIVVDYLQLMRTREQNNNRVQEIGEISRSLKQIARECECPLIALSQLSRNLEHRDNKRPALADLRDSGSIEQDADLIVFIYRDEYYNPNSEHKGKAEIIIGKHRNGEPGKITLTFDAERATFANFTKGEGFSGND